MSQGSSPSVPGDAGGHALGRVAGLIGRADESAALIGRKGGLAVPLFFVGLAAAAFSSHDSSFLLLVCVALVVGAAWLAHPPQAPLATASSIAVTGFAAVALGGAWFWGAHYNPTVVYQMTILVGATMVGRSLGQAGRGAIGLLILAAVASAASAWGLWQFAWLGEVRAEASFETPNLLAAFLNLALVPLAVLTLLRGPRAPTLGALALLLAGLMATESRGGWLGLAGAAGVLALLLAGSGWRPAPRTLAALALAVAAAYGIVRLTPPLAGWASGGAAELAREANAEARSAEARADSAESRLELYAVAADGARARAVLGGGYLSFGRLFERDRARVPSYEPGTATQYVHDDYLQVLLELGLVGLLPFLGITVLPPALAYRRKRALQPSSPRDALGVAAIAGIAAMATHALVDFPFYVPGTLAGYGLLLGIADDWLHPARGSAPSSPRQPPALARVIRVAVIALGAYALAVPAAAETCGLVARERVRRGDIAGAVYWLQVARNFDPRDWRRHWQLAGLLAQQASLLRDPRLAQLAAQAYEAGMRADPGDVHNLLGWLTLERTFGPRLAHPAPRTQLLARMNEAVALAPLDTAVRVERVLMLRYLGEVRQARETERALLRDFPGDRALRRLVAIGEQG